jgi:hypothetical protein
VQAAFVPNGEMATARNIRTQKCKKNKMFDGLNLIIDKDDRLYYYGCCQSKMRVER